MPLTLGTCFAILEHLKHFFRDILAAVEYSLVDGTVPTPNLEFDRTAGALTLFHAALPAQYFQQQRTAAELPPEEQGVYTTAVVMMLIILQRLV
jgi:hypothetical protein